MYYQTVLVSYGLIYRGLRVRQTGRSEGTSDRWMLHQTVPSEGTSDGLIYQTYELYQVMQKSLQKLLEKKIVVPSLQEGLEDWSPSSPRSSNAENRLTLC